MSEEVRLMVDPSRAPKTVKDFEGVTLLQGGSGEIDKGANPDLTPQDIRQIISDTAIMKDGFKVMDAEGAVKAAMTLKQTKP